MALPVIDSIEAVQRDTLASYLVDIVITAWHPSASDLDYVVEWRLDGGAWNAAALQAFDRKHSSSPLTGVPTAAPGEEFNIVWQPFFDLPEGSFENVDIRVTLTEVGPPNDSVDAVLSGLTVSTESPESDTEALDRSLRRRALAERTRQDFLGAGPVIPFRRGSRDFVVANGVELIRSTVRQILGTRAAVGSYPGELPWRPDFGSKLWILRHQNGTNPAIKAQAAAYAQEALRQEPRVEVSGVEVKSFPERGVGENELQIKVRYYLIDENTAENRVVLPEFEETVTITG